MLGYAKTDLLMLDDWGLTPMTDPQRRDLLEDCYGKRSTIVTSQLPVTLLEANKLSGKRKLRGCLVAVSAPFGAMSTAIMRAARRVCATRGSLKPQHARPVSGACFCCRRGGANVASELPEGGGQQLRGNVTGLPLFCWIPQKPKIESLCRQDTETPRKTIICMDFLVPW
jgi:hypothetical protein